MERLDQEGEDMKTLDEVIKAMETCSAHVKCVDVCPYHKDGCIEYGMEKDALHYLKEFKSLLTMWNDKLDKEQTNLPLTWQELQQMEGKPVWVESSLLISNWLIIDEVMEICIICADRFRLSIPLYLDVMGKQWQAYRKEHHES